ncbi:ABC-2 type transport system permease protein [Paenibacillus sp. NFR01]|nr:ABC-2 type transport system permease protein [Paenibacillus sp. NFR01]
MSGLRQEGKAARARKAGAYAFPSGKALFRRRLVSHFHEQWKMIRTAADWTVLLYILIPGALLGGRFYYGFWQGELPDWVGKLPFALFLLPLVYLIVSGSVLLFLQEGDALFLRQRERWMQALIRRGLLYSLGVTALKLAAVFAVLLPFIVRSQGVSSGAAWSLLLLTVACGWCVKLLGHRVKVRYQGFRRWLRLIPAVSVTVGIYVRVGAYGRDDLWLPLLTAAVYLAVGAWAFRSRLRLRGTFLGDVREDYKQRMRIAALLLRGVLDKPRPTRYRPWIFRKSQPLLRSRDAVTRFAAAAIKALLRNPSHLKLYLQFTGVALIAVAIVPSFLKWPIYAVLLLLMAYWLSSFWLVFSGDDYIGILPFTKGQKADAGTKALPIMLMPAALLCALVVCLQMYGIWGVILFIPSGGAGAFIVGRMFSGFRFSR